MRREHWLIAAAVMILVGVAVEHSCHGESLPDPKLTPGAILDTDPRVVFAPGYDHAHRVWDKKLATLVKYGHTRSESHLYEDDDLCPICAGGNNADPANHGLQACSEWRLEGRVYECVAGDAYAKDQLERKKCNEARRVYRLYVRHPTPENLDRAKQALHEVQVYFVSYAWLGDMPAPGSPNRAPRRRWLSVFARWL